MSMSLGRQTTIHKTSLATTQECTNEDKNTEEEGVNEAKNTAIKT